MIVCSIGWKFNCWTVIDGPVRESLNNSHRLWLCRCICGRESWVRQNNLRTGDSRMCRSCSCSRYSPEVQRHHLRLYMKINRIIYRCTNPKCTGWKNYGGRGIKVCQQWMDDRPSFFDYLISLPGWDDLNLTVDRIDNDKGYEPGNIRFATMLTQNNNRRGSRNYLANALIQTRLVEP